MLSDDDISNYCSLPGNLCFSDNGKRQDWSCTQKLKIRY